MNHKNLEDLTKEKDKLIEVTIQATKLNKNKKRNTGSRKDKVVKNIRRR